MLYLRRKNIIFPTRDHVLVSKLLIGARIYTKYDFSDPVMESFRMPGLRRVRPGDVALSGTPDEVLEVHGVYMSRYITTGIATRILFSRDPYSGRIDWSRTLRRIGQSDLPL